jgi:hypothetical protein
MSLSYSAYLETILFCKKRISLLMKTSPFARIQVEILDDIRQRSMAFDDQLFAPRIGEIVSVYDADSDGDEIISGRVIDVRWGYSNGEDGVTVCTVVVRDGTS